jgi:hypothetical protein
MQDTKSIFRPIRRSRKGGLHRPPERNGNGSRPRPRLEVHLSRGHRPSPTSLCHLVSRLHQTFFFGNDARGKKARGSVIGKSFLMAGAYPSEAPCSNPPRVGSWHHTKILDKCDNGIVSLSCDKALEPVLHQK